MVMEMQENKCFHKVAGDVTRNSRRLSHFARIRRDESFLPKQTNRN